jgi:uncharacterized protein (DUF849 family)
MAMVRALRPEAVSLAIRELLPEGADEGPVAEFLGWLAAERVAPQYILHTPEDLGRFRDLRRRGVVPGDRPFVLFVLGRYTKGQVSSPRDLLPYLAAGTDGMDWAACAFGPFEGAAVLTAAALGGHGRVGFENNLYLSDGTVAEDNAALVAQFRRGVRLIGRPIADAAAARAYLAA